METSRGDGVRATRSSVIRRLQYLDVQDPKFLVYRPDLVWYDRFYGCGSFRLVRADRQHAPQAIVVGLGFSTRGRRHGEEAAADQRRSSVDSWFVGDVVERAGLRGDVSSLLRRAGLERHYTT